MDTHCEPANKRMSNAKRGQRAGHPQGVVEDTSGNDLLQVSPAHFTTKARVPSA